MPKKTRARKSTVARSLKAASAAPPSRANVVGAAKERHSDFPIGQFLLRKGWRNHVGLSTKPSALPMTASEAAARRHLPE